MSANGLVRFDASEPVIRITLARPPLNILTTAMLEELAVALHAVATQRTAKLLLLTGEGDRAFCAGVDVGDHTPARVAGMMTAFERVIEALLALELPVVAGLNGGALGGGLELALACDLVLARDDAVVGLPEIRLGVFPPAAAVLLPRRVGRQRALDLILTGRTLRADEAHRLGLVTAVAPSADFAQVLEAYVGVLAGMSAPVLRLAKRAVVSSLESTEADALRHADRIYLEELMRLHDAHEGLAAFLEKRSPEWSDA